MRLVAIRAAYAPIVGSYKLVEAIYTVNFYSQYDTETDINKDYKKSCCLGSK